MDLALQFLMVVLSLPPPRLLHWKGSDEAEKSVAGVSKVSQEVLQVPILLSTTFPFLFQILRRKVE